MKKMAMIRDGVVENISRWDGVSEWNPSGYVLVDVTEIVCGIDWVYQNGVFTAPPIEGEA